jgi:hypothetical protein
MVSDTENQMKTESARSVEIFVIPTQLCRQDAEIRSHTSTNLNIMSEKVRTDDSL